ncbi:hypothetical protein ACF0H5_003310 [Mactra antiquata]
MNQIIKDQKPNTNRKRRSLLPFIGTIGKGLFGLATQEDVQDVARHVNQLIKNSQALELGFRGNNDILQSFINHTDERINNVFDTITENHKVIAALATDFNNNRKSFQENQVLFINAMTKTIKYLTSLENAYGTMLQASTYIPPRLSYCHHHDVNITSLHPDNLALLQQFFKDSSLSMIQANSTYDVPANIPVPQFQIFNHDFSKLVAKDFKEHLNLKKMAEASKNNKQIFTHLVDPLLAMPVESDNNLSSSNIIIVICSCLTVISCIGIIVLYFKYKKLATAVFGSTLVTSTKAAVLPDFHFTTTAMTTLNTSPSNITSLSIFQNHTAVTCMSLLALIFIYKMLKVCLSKLRTNKLILEVTNGKKTVQLHCMNLPTCVHHCDFSGKLCLRGIETKYDLLPYVNINYGDLSIKNKFDENKKLVPHSKIYVNPFDYFKLKSISQNHFAMFIWIKRGNMCIPVNVAYVDYQSKPSTLYPSLDASAPSLDAGASLLNK